MSDDSAQPIEDDCRGAEPYGQASPQIMAMLKSRARRGDLGAVRELATIQGGARRSPLQIPPIKTLEQVATASERILAAAMNGLLTPAEAERLSRLLQAHAEAIKGKVLEQKLAFVEKQIDEVRKKADKKTEF